MDDSAKGPQLPDFWWFTATSAGELSVRIRDALAAGTFVRLEAIPYVKDDLPALRFRVIRSDEVAREEEDVNESFPCPPRCPK